MELTLSCLVPFHGNVLHLRNYVSVRGTHFGECVIDANWHAFKHCNARRIGGCCHTDFFTVNRGAGKLELKSVYQTVFSGLDHFDAAILTKVCDVQCDQRTVVVDGNVPFGVTVRLIVYRNLGLLDNIAAVDNLTRFCISVFVGRTDNSNFFTIVIIYSEFGATEVNTRLSIGFQNLNVTLLEFVGRVNGREGTLNCVNGYSPLSLTITLVIERERCLDYSIGSVRNICGFGITTVIGRPDGSDLRTGRIINRKDRAAKSSVVLGCFLINLNVTFLQLVNCIDSDNTIIDRADGSGPFLCARIGVVCREHSLNDFIGTVRKVFLSTCITV